MELRPYQMQLVQDVRNAWASGARNVLMRLDTGGGKTVILGKLHAEHVGASAVIAHRQELVSQLSMALAKVGTPHNLIAAKSVRAAIARAHLQEFGRCFYVPQARVGVASIDTLVRATDVRAWAAQVTLWTTDEGHHVVEDNKWHTGIQLFTHPEVRGLLPTATPSRADGKGLGRDYDGVADVMVQGPPMRWLIEEGYLTDYRMACVKSDMELLESDIGAGGDWSTAKLRAAARTSHIVGDVVAEYLARANGARGVTFCPDVETATEIYRAYIDAGVKAEILTGDTEDGLRRSILRRFEAGLVEQLVVVDIVSEGFDLPAIQVGSFGRKTASLPTYMQQFGRVLRPMYAPGYDLSTRAGRLAAIANGPKPFALIIDHVGNFMRHGPPDRMRPWTLAPAEKGARRSGPSEYWICEHCDQPSLRTETDCEHCGEPRPAPADRSTPAAVEGDLLELDAEVLAALRGAVENVDRHLDFYREELVNKRVPPVGIMGHVKRFADRQDAQAELRDVMARWAGPLHARGRTDAQIQRQFWHSWGIDVLSAMALDAQGADDLRNRIEAAL